MPPIAPDEAKKGQKPLKLSILAHFSGQMACEFLLKSYPSYGESQKVGVPLLGQLTLVVLAVPWIKSPLLEGSTK